MGKQTCDGVCDGLTIAVWKVIMNKTFRREYSQKKMYFCAECIIDLLDGFGAGPFESDINKIIRIKGKNINE